MNRKPAFLKALLLLLLLLLPTFAFADQLPTGDELKRLGIGILSVLGLLFILGVLIMVIAFRINKIDNKTNEGIFLIISHIIFIAIFVASPIVIFYSLGSDSLAYLKFLGIAFSLNVVCFIYNSIKYNESKKEIKEEQPN